MKRTNRKDWELSLSRGVNVFEENALTALAEQGIRSIELSSGSIEPYKELGYAKPERAAELYQQAKTAGVTINSIHLPFGPFGEIDPASRDSKVRDNCVSINTELLYAAAESGVKIAVIHPSGEPYSDDERAERLDIAIDTIGRITSKAVSAGITLALENLPRTCLCRTYDEMQKFLAAVPELRVCYDMNHCLLQSNVDYIRAVGDKIVTLHISDYDFVDERHWLPGRGKNPWSELLSALEEVGYSGKFTYELGWRDGETTADVVENYSWLMNL